jgi:hypothetical protein
LRGDVLEIEGYFAKEMTVEAQKVSLYEPDLGLRSAQKIYKLPLVIFGYGLGMQEEPVVDVWHPQEMTVLGVRCGK